MAIKYFKFSEIPNSLGIRSESSKKDGFELVLLKPEKWTLVSVFLHIIIAWIVLNTDIIENFMFMQYESEHHPFWQWLDFRNIWYII